MKRTVLFFSILLVAASMQAQDIFKKHGYDREMLTLSKGRYKETFINENVMQIGTVLIDTRTDKVVQFLEEDATEIVYRAESTSRFLTPDPLAEKYPWLSPYVYCMNNPLRYIDPTGEIPTPIEGAIIAGHIYNGRIGETLQGGWTLNRLYTSDNSASYRAGLYSRTVDGVTEYTFANAGTYPEMSKKGLSSMKEDVTQPFGGSKDMRVSINDAQSVSSELGNAELTFVGHSKGGAEAAGNALATNRNALLYNPAAINSSAYGLDPKSYTGADNNGMTVYVVKGDLINGLNNALLAKPIDKIIYLPQQSSNSITNHMIESVINALQEYYNTNR